GCVVSDNIMEVGNTSHPILLNGDNATFTGNGYYDASNLGPCICAIYCQNGTNNMTFDAMNSCPTLNGAPGTVVLISSLGIQVPNTGLSGAYSVLPSPLAIQGAYAPTAGIPCGMLEFNLNAGQNIGGANI